MKVIIKYPNSRPFEADIMNDLPTLQTIVDGYIELLPFAKDAVIIANEEGILKGMHYNLTICGMAIYGPIVICGVAGEDFCDLGSEYIENIKGWFEDGKDK